MQTLSKYARSRRNVGVGDARSDARRKREEMINPQTPRAFKKNRLDSVPCVSDKEPFVLPQGPSCQVSNVNNWFSGRGWEVEEDFICSIYPFPWCHYSQNEWLKVMGKGELNQESRMKNLKMCVSLDPASLALPMYPLVISLHSRRCLDFLASTFVFCEFDQ